MLKKSILFFLLAIVISTPGFAQFSNDTLAIKNTALNYIEGWYNRETERMKKALHPKLIKRIVRVTRDGKHIISEQNANILIENTGKGEGYRVLPSEQEKNVVILDQSKKTAIVKITANDWIDYTQMVKVNNEWKILNVLWEFK